MGTFCRFAWLLTIALLCPPLGLYLMCFDDDTEDEDDDLLDPEED